MSQLPFLNSAHGLGGAGRSHADLTGVGADTAGRVLSAQVKAALRSDAALRAAEVQVFVCRGQVQLCGFVDSVSDIRRAGELARSAHGVRVLFNDLHLR